MLSSSNCLNAFIGIPYFAIVAGFKMFVSPNLNIISVKPTLSFSPSETMVAIQKFCISTLGPVTFLSRIVAISLAQGPGAETLRGQRFKAVSGAL